MTQQLWNGLAAKFETSVCDVTTSSGKQLAELVRRKSRIAAKRWSTPVAASAAS